MIRPVIRLLQGSADHKADRAAGLQRPKRAVREGQCFDPSRRCRRGAAADRAVSQSRNAGQNRLIKAALAAAEAPLARDRRINSTGGISQSARALRKVKTLPSIARLGRKWRQLQFMCPARPILGVQVIERLGDLDRIDHVVAPVLVPR